MFYSLLRPWLYLLDPEDAHNRALEWLEQLARHRELARFTRHAVARPALAPRRILGLEFEHPIGLAAGFDKNARAPLGWWALGFAFIELGTVTPRPQSGHPRPRMFRYPAEHALVNRMGFNNDGAEAVAARLAQQRERGLRPSFPILISVGKNAATPLEQAVEDYAAAARVLAPHADIVTMNVSSPNTPGLRALQSGAALRGLVESVRTEAGGKPVLVKFAPELEGAALDEVCEVCLEAGAAGFIATNTLSTRGGPLPAGSPGDPPEGGLSGRPLRDVSWRRVEQIRRREGSGPVIVGVGGVEDVESARRMLSAGANLVQVYSALVFEGPFVAARLSHAGWGA